MDCEECAKQITRRHFFSSSTGLGSIALASSLDPSLLKAKAIGGLPGLPHFAPKAKRVIYLHQSGGPSQIDLFDYKPQLKKLQGIELPASIRMGQRITGMTSGQNQLPRGARRCSSSSSTASPERMGQRTAAAHREDGRRHEPSSKR